jgi:DNA polymerase-3 subunit gamma/tau
MAHAQRLIPIEQLLTDVAATPGGGSQRPQARPAIVSAASNSETRRPEPPAARSNYVSPFAADSARKGTPRQEDSSSSVPPPGPRIVAAASQPEPIIMGSAAPAPDRDLDSDRARNVPAGALEVAEREAQPQAEAEQSRPVSSVGPDEIEKLQSAVLQALTDANQRILVSMLSAGEWSVQGNELVIKVAESQTVVDMSLGPEGKRLAVASASGVLGRAVKFKVLPGAAAPSGENKRNGSSRLTPGPGGRGRAEQDPIVRRMQEKFGAEIRTVIDYRDKR